MMSDPGLPAWARDDAFPVKPDSAPFGAVDSKGQAKPFEKLDDLMVHLGSGKGRMAWIWTPENERMVAPEEVPELLPVLKKRRLIFATEDEEEARKTLPFTGIIGLYAFYSLWKGAYPMGFPANQFLAIAGFAFLYFTARPWWEAFKGRKEAAELSRENLAEEIPEARFDLWMGSQKSNLTIGLVVLIALVGIVQLLTPGKGIAEAGLDKTAYALGETWRLFTAAFLHGNVIHFLLNASALYYLARRVEIVARWPHVAATFLISILGAGWATVSWLPKTSVGVSGVVCGLLGFLLVFETLHRPLVPRSARRRLLGILVSLGVIGFIGFQFVDNAAHFGGLVAGAAYAFLVFPKSSSPHRPIILKRDRVLGAISLGLIFVSALGAVVAMTMR